MVTRTRWGRGQAGCLIMLLVLAAMGYFGLGVGQVYWNYFQYKDRMQQEARFAGSRTDGVIRRRIAMFADSIGLPESAKQVRVRRQQRHIYIWAEYYESIELPFISKQLLLAPRAEWTY